MRLVALENMASRYTERVHDSVVVVVAVGADERSTIDRLHATTWQIEQKYSGQRFLHHNRRLLQGQQGRTAGQMEGQGLLGEF